MPTHSLERPDNRLLLGRGGSGKSTLWRGWVIGSPGRVIVHDYAHEKANGHPFAVEIYEYAELVRVLAKHPQVRRICWRGYSNVAMDADDAFELANRAAWAAENVTSVWEEIDQCWPNGARPFWANKIVQVGRHRGLRTIACARRAASLSRNHTANVQRLVAFQTIEPLDVDYLRHWIGEAAAQLPALDFNAHQALDWTERGATVKKSPFP